MQQRLKPETGAARARVVAAQFFEQFLVPVDHPVAAFDAGFRRVALPPFARDLKTSAG
jgi:hypothetical protein